MPAIPLLLVFTLGADASTVEFSPPKKLMKNFTSTTGCEKDDVQPTFLDSYVKDKAVVSSWEIGGCPQSPFIMTYWARGGGWSWWTDVDLRKKAPFDFDCPAQDLKYTFIDSKNRGIEGCDKRATYVLTSAGWIANVTSD